MNISVITNAVKTFFVKNKLLVVGALAIVALFLVNRYNYEKLQDAEKEIVRVNANLNAAKDTIRIYKTNDGTLNYQKLAYIAKNFEELKTLNSNLYKEVQNLKGQIKFIQKTEYSIIHDTVPLIVKSEIKDSVLYLTSTYDTIYSAGNYRSLAIENKYNFKTSEKSGLLTKDKIGFTAVTGLKATDKGYEIFVNPKYPGMEIVNLEGAFVDPTIFSPKLIKQKPKLITIGASIGWVPVTYEFNNNKLDINLNRIGASVGFNFNINRILNK